MAAQVEVKTERLPYVSLVRGKYWYFQRGSLTTRITGEYGDDEFLWHYNELCRIAGVPGVAFVDDRKAYFIGWVGGPIKIGMAGDVKSRRDMLQVSCPYDLEILAVVSTGGRATELDYHRQFKAWHMRGDWFERCPEIEAEIERLNRHAQ